MDFTEVLKSLNIADYHPDGHFTVEVYADYNDSLDKNTLKSIVSCDHPKDMFHDLVFEGYRDAADSELDFIVDKIQEQVSFDDEYEGEETVRQWVYNNVHANLPWNHYYKTPVNVNIVIDTGDGNYDFTLNNFFSYNSQSPDEIPDESSILWLVQQQGYTKQDLLDTYYAEEVNSPFLASVFRELVNPTTHMNALVFFKKMTFGEYLNWLETPTDIVVDKNISCGLLDFWGGAGSCLEISLEKPMTLPLSLISLHVDGCRGYGVDDVYGMCDSFWK